MVLFMILFKLRYMKTKLYVLLVLSAVVGIYSNAYAQVKAEFSTPDTLICEGSKATFTAASTNVSVYYWIFGDNPGNGVISTTNNVINHQYFSSGSFAVTLVVSDGLGNWDTAYGVVQVKPKVHADFSLNQSPNPTGVFCKNTTFTISQWGNLTGFDSLSWDFGDGYMSELRYPRHTYTMAGTYDLKLKAFGFCGMDSTDRQIIIVDDSRGRPNLNLYVSPNKICLEEKVGIQANTYDLELTSFSVSTGDGYMTNLDDFQYGYDTSGSYTLTAVGSNACGTDTAYSTVTVGNDVDNGPWLYSDQSICPGRPAIVRFGASKLDSAFVDFGDGDTAIDRSGMSNLSHAYMATGNYTVKVVFFYSNCSAPDTLKTTLEVKSMLNSGNLYAFANPQEVCPDEFVYVNSSSIGPTDTMIIDYGDGTIMKYADVLPQLKHTYSMPGIYTVKLYRKVRCGNTVYTDSTNTTATVKSSILTGLVISSDFNSSEELRCLSDSVTFRMNPSSGEIRNPKFYFPDGTVYDSTMVRKAIAQKGKFRVVATAENYCGIPIRAAYTYETTTRMLNPSISGYHYPRTQCVNQEFFFDVFTQNADSFVWDFDNGDIMSGITGPHVMYAYSTPGTYDVKLTASNRCGQTTETKRVYVEAGPMIDFSMSAMTINKGDTVHLTNKTTGAIHFLWVFNNNSMDTTSEMNPSRKYPNAGTYPISLYAIDRFGCWDTLSKKLVVGNVGIATSGDEQNILTAYPNPTSGTLTIQLDRSFKMASIGIYDLSGRALIMRKIESGVSRYDLDLSNLETNTYILQLNTGSGVYSKRFIVLK